MTYGVFDGISIFGQEGVVIFFVVSGIVIAHVAKAKEHAPRPYAIARLSRLWSVVVPAIALTILLDVIGVRLAPALYQEANLPPMWDWDLPSVWRALAPVLFLNRVGGGMTDPGTNGPFWSLCYEFWYYAAFGIYSFTRGYRRILLLIAVLALVNRDVVALFPIWLLGVYVYAALNRPVTPAQPKRDGLLWLLSGAAMILVMVLKYRVFALITAEVTIPEDILLLLEKYVVGLLFALNIISLHKFRGNLSKSFAATGPSIRWIAGRSFSLYLYQAPMIFCVGALTSGVASHSLRIGLMLVGTLGPILLLASVTELKKKTVAGWLSCA